MATITNYGNNNIIIKELPLESIFVDFNSKGIPQESQIYEHIIERSGKKYVHIQKQEGATGFINEDFVFEIQNDTDYNNIAMKMAFNIAYAMQFGETNLIFTNKNNSLLVEYDIYDKEIDQYKSVYKNIPVVTLDDVKILVGNSYYSLFDIEHIKSELTGKNINYSKLPVAVISYVYDFINGSINIEEDARIMCSDYLSSSCSFINSIMNGGFDLEKFNPKHFCYEREYIIDKKYIDRFYKFISSFQIAQSDMIVYRTTHEYSLNSNSFISTSLSKYFASEWERSDKQKKLNNIYIPKDSLFFTPIFYDKSLGAQEAEVILLPGTFEILEQNGVYIYSGKSIEEVMSLFLSQLEQQKKEILIANHQDEKSFDEAILYGKNIIINTQKNGMKK